MRVELSLAESLINAITHGKIRGVQWKRGATDERAAFQDLQAVIGRKLDDAAEVARSNALEAAYRDKGSVLKVARENDQLRELVRGLLPHANCFTDHSLGHEHLPTLRECEVCQLHARAAAMGVG